MGCTIYLNQREFSYPVNEELNKKLNYFERLIGQPTDYRSELFHIRYENPEWMLFSLSFSSYAFTNIVFLDTTFRARAELYIDKAIQKVLSDTIYRDYCLINPISPVIDSTASVLYLGHLNMMLGCYKLVSEKSKYDVLNDSLTESLYKRFTTSASRCLESYPHSIWVPDNTVALASLKIHDMNSGTVKYSRLCSDWIEYAKTHFIEGESKLLYSTIDYSTGKASEEPRGSMLGWSIMFISRFDKDFALQQYDDYKKQFSSGILMFRLFKERINNFSSGKGDIDSGPLFMGFSIPANAWAFGNAVYFKDLKTAAKMERLIKLGSKKMESDSEIKYEVRFVDMNMSPLAEALILYMETMTEWKKLGNQLQKR